MRIPRRLALILLAGLAAAGAQPAAGQAAAPYQGLKKTVSVDPVLAADAVGGTVTTDGLTAMLIDALARDGRFVVVEHTAAADAAQPTATAASAIVRAAVTKYEPAAGGGSLGVAGLPLGSLLGARAGVRGQKAVMEISLRLVDAGTSQVLSTSKAQGVASSSGVDGGLVHSDSGASLGGGAFRATPIGKAGEAAIGKAVEQIAAAMRDVPWSALVVDAADGRVYVNAGSDRNVEVGTALHAYRKGRTLTDPSTGAVLDVELQPVGEIRIVGVRERLSTAVVVSGEPPTRGDVVRAD